ncbi:MAG: protein kinase [Anaerolineae bacterium]|nr:protein kinase [Anaerolineae bacterium]
MLESGTMLGGYQIVEQVGQGGMATVYKAYHARLDRHVAIKVMHQMLAQEGDFQARFEREARIIARLDHPSIVPIYDISEYEGESYLVMKYVEGHTLEDRLKQGAIPLREIPRVMRPVAEALAYAHKQGILHRDVKPSNIILADNGMVYLTDFGLARLVQMASSTMSQGTMIGTPHYISPEQALGQKELDARTDLYSLGVVLYELVVGRVPYAGDTPFSIVHDHIYSPLPSPSAVNPDVSPAVEAVLVRALAKDPADRYQSALALADAFEEALSGAAPARPARAETRSPAQPRARTPEPAPRASREEQRKASKPARRPKKKEFEFNFAKFDWDDLGEVIEDKVESWGEAIEDWAEQFEDKIEGKVSSSKRRRSKAPLTPEEELRRKIEKRLKEQQEFRTHVVIYIMVNLLLWFIWLASGAGFPWPFFPTLGWGIGIVAHYMEYHHKYGRGAERRERLIQEELERARLSGRIPYESDKRKNEDLIGLDDQRLRLADDGELSDSFIEQVMDEDKPKRSLRK